MDRFETILTILAGFREDGEEQYKRKTDLELVQMTEEIMEKADQMRQEQSSTASQETVSPQ